MESNRLATSNTKSSLDPEAVWNGLRPIQRRELLELSLSEKEKDNFEIQESLNFIVFRKFKELKPVLKKSIKFMLGG